MTIHPHIPAESFLAALNVATGAVHARRQIAVHACTGWWETTYQDTAARMAIPVQWLEIMDNLTSHPRQDQRAADITTAATWNSAVWRLLLIARDCQNQAGQTIDLDALVLAWGMRVLARSGTRHRLAGNHVGAAAVGVLLTAMQRWWDTDGMDDSYDGELRMAQIDTQTQCLRSQLVAAAVHGCMDQIGTVCVCACYPDEMEEIHAQRADMLHVLQTAIDPYRLHAGVSASGVHVRGGVRVQMTIAHNGQIHVHLGDVPADDVIGEPIWYVWVQQAVYDPAVVVTGDRAAWRAYLIRHTLRRHTDGRDIPGGGADRTIYKDSCAALAPLEPYWPEGRLTTLLVRGYTLRYQEVVTIDRLRALSNADLSTMLHIGPQRIAQVREALLQYDLAQHTR